MLIRCNECNRMFNNANAFSQHFCPDYERIVNWQRLCEERRRRLTSAQAPVDREDPSTPHSDGVIRAERDYIYKNPPVVSKHRPWGAGEPLT